MEKRKKRPEVPLNRANEMDGAMRIAPCPWCIVMEEETRLPGKYSSTGPPPKYKQRVTYLKWSIPKEAPQKQKIDLNLKEAIAVLSMNSVKKINIR